MMSGKNPIRLTLTALFLFMVLLSPGCNKAALERPIDADIEVFAYRDGQTVWLRFLTSKEYPCSNYQIKHSYSIIGDNIKVKLKYIENSETCLTATGPAVANIKVGSSPKTTYNLSLKMNGSNTTGRLFTEELRIELENQGPFYTQQ